MKPLVMAGTTENMGDLVEYLINSGVRYKQESYGPRPAKFAVVLQRAERVAAPFRVRINAG